MIVVRSAQHLVVMILLPILLLQFLTGCNQTTATEPTPPEIHYGEDMCEFCGMIISEERFAAGYISADGREHVFDDLAGMFQAHLQSGDVEAVTAFFVHDYEDNSWIRAETAHYVLSQELPTPMLSGLVAFANPGQAATLAAEVEGQLLTFDEVMARFEERASMGAEAQPEHHH
jgi:copper chaperone NosL